MISFKFYSFLLLQLQLCVLSLKCGPIKLPDHGTIFGLEERTFKTAQNICQFFGIPYAKSPSGDLRFKPPVARSSWTGIRNATVHGRPCPKKGVIFKDRNDDPEDCLTVDVYTKNFIKKYPVMVYIHGGGFYSGSSVRYKPINLLEHDVVLVVAQYRIGVLGFLSTGTAEIPGNMGVLDLIFALGWVNKYISYFGGNSNRVTIFGCSAGAAIVSGLAISPAVPQGYFHRVIIQSGNILCGWAEKPDSLDVAKHVCKKAKCSSCEDATDINMCMKSLNLKQLLQAGTGNQLRITDKYSLVSHDYGNVFPDDPKELIKKSRKYPMMLGVVKHEGSFVLAAIYDYLDGGLEKHGVGGYIDSLLKNLKEEDESGAIKNLALTYLFKKDPDNLVWNKLREFAGIVAVKAPLFNFAQLSAKYSSYPIYLYTFDYRGRHTYFGYGEDTKHYPFNGGVHHSDDYMYLLATVTLKDERDIWMIEMMTDLWTSFAINAVPTSNKVSEWQAFKGVGPYIHINEKSYLGTNFLDEFQVDYDLTKGFRSYSDSCGIILTTSLIPAVLFLLYIY